MRRLSTALLALVATLVAAGTALAGATTYAGPKMWSPGEGAGSAYSSSWNYNYFFKEGGYDATVTFIDNVTYAWHATVRGTGSSVYTYWFVSNVKKGHCRSNTGYHWGSCVVVN